MTSEPSAPLSTEEVDDIFGEGPSSPSTADRASPALSAPAAAFVEAEAEVEGEGGPSGDEEDDEDDGAGMQGFIDDGEGAVDATTGVESPKSPLEAEAGSPGADDKDDGAGSSDAEDFEEDDALDDLDDMELGMMRDLGIDISKHTDVKARQAEPEPSQSEQKRTRTMEDELFGEDDDDLEGSPKRPRTQAMVVGETAEDLEANLFGPEEGEEDADKEKPRPEEEDFDLFGDDDVESMEDFIVDGDQESKAKRRKKASVDEAAELDITEDQLNEIIDIFGNTDVLKPVDEMGFEEDSVPRPPPLLPTESQAQTPFTGDSAKPLADGLFAEAPTPVEPGVSPVPASSQAPTLGTETPQPGLTGIIEQAEGADPDYKEMMYELDEDKRLEKYDAPERWVQTYMSQPFLLTNGKVRRWTEEEEDAETTWIYMTAFWKQWYEKPQAEDLIKKILHLLHIRKLEPQYILAHYMWQFGKFFYEQDMQRIFDLDHHWQKVWVLYRRLLAWINRLRNEGREPPDYIVNKLTMAVWSNKDAEQELTDTWDWMCAMHPDSEEAAQAVRKSHDLQKMAAAIQFGLHEKLGIVDSIDGAPLQVFGITPAELGLNIDVKKQVYKPKESTEFTKRIDPECKKHVVPGSLLHSGDAVKEVICLLLSRLIAAEPRVRSYVRSEFWERCAISTRPTRQGKEQAEDAAAGFRDSYRAYHIVNRPVKSFLPDPEAGANPPVDILWLDVVDLHKRGFLEVEYSLVQPKEGAKRIEDGYLYILQCHDEKDMSQVKNRLNKHFDKLKDPFWNPTAKEVKLEEFEHFSEMERLRHKLLMVSRSAEVVSRLKAVQKSGTDEMKRVAEALFRAAKMLIRSDEKLTEPLMADPIYEKLCNLYCYTDFAGETETFIVPSPWNDLRKKIIRHSLRNELYPMMWKEVQAQLSSVVQREVCRQCVQTLTKLIDLGPFCLTHDELSQNQWKRPDEESDSDDEDWKQEKAKRLAGQNVVLTIVPDITTQVTKDSAIVSVVNEFGEAVVQHALFRSFWKVNPDDDGSLIGPDRLRVWLKEKEHYELFKSLLKRYRPAIIVLPIVGDEASPMKFKLEKMFAHDQSMRAEFKVPPQILFCDATIPRLVAYHPRIKEEGVYADCANPQQRIAISAARFIQDAFAETAQLWHEKPEHNFLFQLPLHRLQHAIPREMLQRAMLQPLTAVLAKAGLDVNRIRRCPHIASVLPFASGLGPRKARLFKRCINNLVQSKSQLGTLIAKQLDRPTWEEAAVSSVVANVLPFCKLHVSEDAEREIDGFDRTRLPDFQRPWLDVLCKHALQWHNAESEQRDRQDVDSDDDVIASLAPREPKSPNSLLDGISSIRSPHSDPDLDPIGDAMGDGTESRQVMEKQVQKDWILRAMQRSAADDKSAENSFQDALLQATFLSPDEWQIEVNKRYPNTGQLPEEADINKLLGEVLIPEILKPFEDKRAEFTKVDPLQLFYIMSGETEEKLRNGALVSATVEKDKEYAVDDDGAKLFEDRKEVDVMLMPWGVKGVFQKTYNEKLDKGKSGYIEGCDDQFEPGDTVRARVISILTKEGAPPRIKLSVDKDAELWRENFPIKMEDQAFYVPESSEDWTKLPLGKIGITEVEKKRMLKEWVDRPRNIRHPNFYKYSQTNILDIIKKIPLGTTIFRPSKRFDVLLGLLKVRDTNTEWVDELDMTYRCFDIVEKVPDGVKTHGNSFELAQELEVDGASYKDFDDLIARCMDPIMENLRLFQEHKRFGLSMGMETRKKVVEQALFTWTKNASGNLHYVFLLHDKSPGHGLMLWALGGKKVREEMIEITPQGFSLWGQNFAYLVRLVEWFKKDGWKQSSQLRKAWWEKRKERAENAIKNRGEDAICKAPNEVFGGYETRSSGLFSGLSTPGGAGGYMTPTNYQTEAAAPTPVGLGTPRHGMSTPGGDLPATPSGMSTPFHRGGRGDLPATPSGMSTPFHRAAPGTPSGMSTPFHRSAPGTPTAGRSGGTLPSTPSAALRRAAAGTPAGPPPGTPGMARLGSTAAGPPPTPDMLPAAGTPGMRPYGAAAGTPGYAPPATPSPAFYRSGAPGTPGYSSYGAAAGTPAGPPPATPAPGNYRAASATPGGSLPMTPASAGYFGGTMTPAGPPPATPGPGLYRAAGTPAGPPPGTPGLPGLRNPGTPAGPPPATPAPGLYRAAAGTPAGPPPATPSPGFYRAASGTPGGGSIGSGGSGGLGSPGLGGPQPAPMTPGMAAPLRGAKTEEKDEKKTKSDAYNELFD